jgi:hypothetical protein
LIKSRRFPSWDIAIERKGRQNVNSGSDGEFRERDQRRAPRYRCEHSAELFAADGAPHVVDLCNISEGGGQVSLSGATATALGLPQVQSLRFCIWLPGDAEESPLEGKARVAYLVVPPDDGSDLLMGLEFLDMNSDDIEQVRSFIDTCLRYIG